MTERLFFLTKSIALHLYRSKPIDLFFTYSAPNKIIIVKHSTNIIYWCLAMLQLMMKANMDSIYVYTITRINKNILEKQCQWAKSSEDAIAVV
jgi:hypothetical protein